MSSHVRALRPPIAALAAILIAVLLPSSPARAVTVSCASRPANGDIATRLHTFTVTAEPVKPAYRLGTKAMVEVTVTRPAPEDPLNNGIPLNSPVALAAEGVEVSVGLYRGTLYMYGMGVTDADGKVLIPIKLDPRTPAGNTEAEIAARAYYNRGGCPEAEEEGFASYPRFFKATK